MQFSVFKFTFKTNVEPYISLQDTRYRPATPSRIRLLVFLYHVALGDNYRSVANQFSIGVSNVSKIIHDVTSTILSYMWSDYIRLPNAVNAQESMRTWKQQTGIPGIAGALDGTYIQIKKPSNQVAPEVYYNRKSFYSVNVQG